MRQVVFLTAVLLVACGEAAEEGVTPQPAAFEMTVLAVDPCDGGVEATTCVRVQVTNRGDLEGDGHCRLRGHIVTPSGQEQQVFGPRIEVSDLPGHSSVEEVLRWVKEMPGEGFSGVCQPGLKM